MCMCFAVVAVVIIVSWLMERAMDYWFDGFVCFFVFLFVTWFGLGWFLRFVGPILFHFILLFFFFLFLDCSLFIFYFTFLFLAFLAVSRCFLISLDFTRFGLIWFDSTLFLFRWLSRCVAGYFFVSFFLLILIYTWIDAVVGFSILSTGSTVRSDCLLVCDNWLRT